MEQRGGTQCVGCADTLTAQDLKHSLIIRNYSVIQSVHYYREATPHWSLAISVISELCNMTELRVENEVKALFSLHQLMFE